MLKKATMLMIFINTDEIKIFKGIFAVLTFINTDELWSA